MSELMKMSFEMRRNVIISEAKPLQDLLLAFPFLGDPEEVRTERHMLTTNFFVVILDYLGVVSHPLESPITISVFGVLEAPMAAQDI